MSDSLFDRYREVLRAGHVAVLRGRLEDAAASYREAALLAADRAVPRTALGSVQLRLGQPDQALATFDEALALAPADDAALLGRAQALVVLERPDDAAATFDTLADARRAAGKHADAGDALRRALEIQPTAARRQRYQELADELRQAVGAAEAERALARALRYLEMETAQGESPPAEPARSPEPASPEPASPEPAVAPVAPPDPARQGEALLLASEEAAARGDAPDAVTAAISAAHAFRDANHPVAALDACTRGLDSGPDDVSLHLLIAELALERGAIGPAGDTYRNLLRLAEIDGDPAARERVAAAARAAFPDDPRFAPA
jgi:tetratricopeptide (TPR) repeat protein